MVVGDTRVSWLSHTSANTNFFPKPPTTFLTCFSRGERRKYARKKFHLNQGSNSQPPGHETDTLTLAHMIGKSTGVVPRNHSREISVCLSHSHKLLNQTNLKAFADNITNITKMMISVFNRAESIVSEGEIVCTSNFSFSHNLFKRLLSQTFHKVSWCGNGLESFFHSVHIFELSLNSTHHTALCQSCTAQLVAYRT